VPQVYQGERMLIKAFNYKQWSDLRTLDAIENIDGEKFSSSIKFVLQQLNHIVIVEELFKACILGNLEPHTNTNSVLVPVFQELKQRL
jgi:uncharacterized damage-inducible protein DinB